MGLLYLLGGPSSSVPSTSSAMVSSLSASSLLAKAKRGKQTCSSLHSPCRKHSSSQHRHTYVPSTIHKTCKSQLNVSVYQYSSGCRQWHTSSEELPGAVMSCDVGIVPGFGAIGMYWQMYRSSALRSPMGSWLSAAWKSKAH